MENKDLNHGVVVYDSNCRFCQAKVKKWQKKVGQSIEFKPTEEKLDSIKLILDNQEIHSAEAVFKIIALGGNGTWTWMYKRVPFFKVVSEFLYKLVAKHRHNI